LQLKWSMKASCDIEGVLGFTTEPEMIHRDNLVLA
jgi:hypothetical protein